MAFKMRSEAKIGLFVIISVLVFFVGFNYLKGKGLFDTSKSYFIIYDNVQGLQPANLVVINGYQVGKIKQIDMLPDMKFRVTLSVDKKVELPNGTVAQMQAGDLLSAGSKNIELVLGKEPGTIAPGATLPSQNSVGLLDGISAQVGPTMDIVKGVLTSVDTLVKSVNGIVDNATRGHIQHSVTELDEAMAHINAMTASINGQMSQLTGIMANVNSVTTNLKSNNERINGIMTNFNAASKTIAEAPIAEAMQNLRIASANLNQVIGNINSKNGSLGMLINDPQLYNNLSNLSGSLDSLMIDLKKHPSRYVNLSVFGGKGK